MEKYNSEKLEKIADIFVKDIGEKYLDNLQKIYLKLKPTLLNSEYVDNLTEEKLDTFLNENSKLLQYFNYFEFEELYSFHTNIPLPSKNEVIPKVSHIVTIIKEFIKIKEKIEQNLKDTNTIELPTNFISTPRIFKNIYIPEFNYFTKNISEIINLKTSSNTIFKNNIKLIERTFNKNKRLNLLQKNIPTGIIFFHLCNWFEKEYIEKIELKNYYSIKNIKIPDFTSKEIYFLGENGVGKTILLQAILTAIKPLVGSKSEFSCKILPEYMGNETWNGKIEKAYAYGVHRNRIATSQDASPKSYLTLFKNDVELKDPIQWLQKLKLQELQEKEEKNTNKQTHITYNTAVKLLTDLLDNNVEIKVISGDVIFIENETNHIEFFQLAEGYKSVIIWVVDLIIRMSSKQPYITELEDFRGTVLIDELDLFLHPKWAYKIMKKLRTWFPNIHFVITTHSPILILGASEDAIFYKLYKENGETKISEPVKGISNLMANSIITSPLFGMEQAYSRATKNTENLRLGDDFIYDKIHDFVVNEIKNRNNIEEKDIMDLIKEKYNKIL